MSRQSKDKITNTPVARALLKISAPMSLGILGVLLIGLADAYFLARVGETELAAIGFVYPVIVAISAFSIGMSAGANAVFSQAIGRDASPEAVARMTFHATGFGAALGVSISILFVLVAPWLFSLLGAKGAVLDAVLVYVMWWAASLPFLVVTMILEAAFKAAGDGKTPSVSMVFTALLNVALTPIFVFGWGPVEALGMAGAGIATLIARAVVGLWILWLVIRQGRIKMFGAKGPNLGESIGEITSVGLSAAASNAIKPAGMAVVTAAVATVGDQAVAGFGAAVRVQAIITVPFLALAAGLAPVVGQAWGAELPARAQQALRLSAWFVVIYGLVAGLALWAFAEPIGQVMTASGAAAEYTAQYLRVVGWSLAGYGLVLAANAALTARSRATWALGLSLTQIGLFYVPLAWAGVSLFGYTGILAAAVVANAMGAWLALSAAHVNRLLVLRRRFLSAPAAVMRRVATPFLG